MLERVRKALGRSAAGGDSSPDDRRSTFPALGKVLAPIPAESLIDTFEKELNKVGGITHRAGSAGELDQILRGILDSTGAGPVVLSRNALLRRLEIPQKLESWGRSVAAWPGEGAVDAEKLDEFRALCFNAAAGITGADFALAESGSLVLTSLTEGSQLVSLAPPLHIALYRRSQVVESLEETLSGLSAGYPPSAAAAGRSVVFITGQSRTADIEQISIRGVHGPLSIHAVLVEEPWTST